MPPYFEDTDFVQIGKIIAYAANIASGTVVSLGAAVDEVSSEHLIETTYFKEQEDTKEFLEDNLKALNRKSWKMNDESTGNNDKNSGSFVGKDFLKTMKKMKWKKGRHEPIIGSSEISRLLNVEK